MWVFWAATFSQLLPFAGLLRFGRRLTPVRRWVLVWSAVFFLADVLAIVVAQRSGRNLWTQYLVTPVENVILLYTFSLWQQNAVARLTFRAAIPLFLLAWVALVFTVEDVNGFSLFAWPFQALVMLAASLFTLVSRALAEPERVTSRDWFWVSLATSLYFAPGTAIHPFSQIFLATHPELVLLAYKFRAAINVVAFALIARGMLCPLTPERSGGSSPQARWPSPSFSSPSAPRS